MRSERVFSVKDLRMRNTLKEAKCLGFPADNKGLSLQRSHEKGNFHEADKGSVHTSLDKSNDISGEKKTNNIGLTFYVNWELKTHSYRQASARCHSSIFPLLHYQKIYQAIQIMPF